jgi:hypothetical protein
MKYTTLIYSYHNSEKNCKPSLEAHTILFWNCIPLVMHTHIQNVDILNDKIQRIAL